MPHAITARSIARHPVNGTFTRRCTKRIPYGKSLHEKEYIRIPPKFYKYRRRDANGKPILGKDFKSTFIVVGQNRKATRWLHPTKGWRDRLA